MDNNQINPKTILFFRIFSVLNIFLALFVIFYSYYIQNTTYVFSWLLLFISISFLRYLSKCEKENKELEKSKKTEKETEIPND